MPTAAAFVDGGKPNRIRPPPASDEKRQLRRMRELSLSIRALAFTCRRTISGRLRRRDHRRRAASHPNIAGRRQGGRDSGRCHSSLLRTESTARRHDRHPSRRSPSPARRPGRCGSRSRAGSRRSRPCTSPGTGRLYRTRGRGRPRARPARLRGTPRQPEASRS